jgi:hypothetical protein
VTTVSISRLAIRFARFLVFRVGVPVFTMLLVLGTLSGGHNKMVVSPSPLSVAQSLQQRHVLPKGTSVSMGDPADPLTVVYDASGRIVITPPTKVSVGELVTRGFDEAAVLLHGQDLQVAGVKPSDSSVVVQ